MGSSVRIVSLDPKPAHRVRYVNAGRRGRAESVFLPILFGEVDGLPRDVDALVLASDLQGVCASWRADGGNVLLGVHLVDELLELAEAGRLPYPERTGVVLAGDLFAAPGGDVRGATGDVRPVWTAFAEAFRWVVGVQGNHDQFGTVAEAARLRATDGVHLLDGELAALDGVTFGGVGEIIGDPRKPGRKEESELLAHLALIAEERPDVIVLHQGPPGRREQRGSDPVRDALAGFGGLVVCGHVHWDEPLFEPASGPQVLNVDSRVVVLQRA